MALIDIKMPNPAARPDRRTQRFLKEADRRVEDFIQNGRITGFVPSDYNGASQILPGLLDSAIARGNRFCEWGCGFGVVADLAANLGFDASGIETEWDLIAQARELADDFELEVDFVHGSFVPPGAEMRVHAWGTYSWFTTEADSAYEELGLDPDDFDIIFAYPWPDEEEVTADLFDRYAGIGALLVTYQGGGDFRCRRKAVGSTRAKGKAKKRRG